jgi:hypothetical protein
MANVANVAIAARTKIQRARRTSRPRHKSAGRKELALNTVSCKSHRGRGTTSRDSQERVGKGRTGPDGARWGGCKVQRSARHRRCSSKRRRNRGGQGELCSPANSQPLRVQSGGAEGCSATL